MTAKSANTKKQRVRLDLDPDVADKLRALARRDKRTLSACVTVLIDAQELPGQ